MPDDTKNNNAEPNPGNQQEGKQNPPVVVQPNPMDDLVKKLQEENDILKRQYKGSSEEALRLKKELEDKSKAPKRKVDSDDVFKELVDAEGTVGAIRHLISETLHPIVSKVEKLYDSETEKIHSAFTSKHPGLAKVKDQFTKELNRLKVVYDNIEEAMEAAYRLVGGLEADQAIANDASQKQETAQLAKQSENEKQRLEQHVAGGGDDKRTPPANPIADLERQIKDLEDKALLFSLQGKTSQESELRVKAERLKAEIAKKRQS